MNQMNGHAVEPMATPSAADFSLEYESSPTPDGIPPTPPPMNSTQNLTGGVEALDFSLAIKPRGTPAFKLSALYKSRLRFCILLHFNLFFIMLAKLSEDILDRMDIFILELEELYIPKPLIWEWIWTSSILLAFLGMNAMSRNRLSTMKCYVGGIMLFGICPLLGGAVYFFNDIWEYAELKNAADIEKWQGYPIAAMWYAFIMIAFQVHLFSIYFAMKLIKMWRVKGKKC